MANHKKTKRPRKPSHPLPKVGSPADDAYRLEHSRHDLVDFGLAEPRKGPLNWVIVAVVGVVMVAGIVSLILFT